MKRFRMTEFQRWKESYYDKFKPENIIKDMRFVPTYEQFINESNDTGFEIELGKLLMPWSKYDTYLLDKSFVRSLSIKKQKTYYFIVKGVRYSGYFNETTPKSGNYMVYDIKK